MCNYSKYQRLNDFLKLVSGTCGKFVLKIILLESQSHCAEENGAMTNRPKKIQTFEIY